ncbi:MAG TPA: hypothetical protein VEI07_10005, partial [Planctomycetaceae bacterium]|nr:hypothetical protein [Planctomycetaceae bacterium]
FCAVSTCVRKPADAVSTCVVKPADALCRNSRLVEGAGVKLGGPALSVTSTGAAAVLDEPSGRRSKCDPLSSGGKAGRLGIVVEGAPGIGSPGTADGG